MSLTVVVLAAGEGTRMKSATPKVLHEIAGRPLLGHVLDACAGLLPDRVIVVVGHGREQVGDYLAAHYPSAKAVVQDAQRGTGHAVRVALEAHPDIDGTLVVLSGDAPLVTTATLQELVAAHSGNAGTLLTAELEDPTGYGRIIRSPGGSVTAIVEERDAGDTTKQIREIATSIYAFDAQPLRAALSRLTTDNAKGEEYLTDVVALFVADGYPVGAFGAADWRETLGVNDRVQLAQAGSLLRDRINERWMLEGVTITDPASTWIDVDVVLDSDVTLLPNTRLCGSTRVERGASIGPDCTLTDTTVGPGAQISTATCVEAEVGPAATVGPYAYLRPGARLARGARAGTYVEIKNATIGTDSKVPHLSYVGDATIGERTNIGAATVFVNYDGVEKHHTGIGNDVRIGSDTMLVAPVEVGDGAYTAAGSVITEDVPPGALGVGRARQRNVEGWVARRRGKGDK